MRNIHCDLLAISRAVVQSLRDGANNSRDLEAQKATEGVGPLEGGHRIVVTNQWTVNH